MIYIGLQYASHCNHACLFGSPSCLERLKQAELIEDYTILLFRIK